MTFDEHTAILEGIAIPIWLIDYVDQKMIWGNAKAIELWGASDLEDLRKRDFTNTSAAIRLRHRATQTLIEAGNSETRLVTFYPQGRSAVTVRCHISGFRMNDGRVIALTQAVDTAVAVDSEQLRGVDAIRRIGAIVTVVDNTGAVLMQNPAGTNAFGSNASFHGWFVDKNVAPELERSVQSQQTYRTEAQVETNHGLRWHSIEAHPSIDPVTGSKTILIVQVDVTENRLLREALELQTQQIHALSVPILDVGRGVLAVPLIGTLDEQRSTQIASQLLPEVARRAPKTVILDLTGVTTLDAASAESLMGVTRALSLLGTQPILTGIQPILAKTLTANNMDLGKLVTLRNLREGLLWNRSV